VRLVYCGTPIFAVLSLEALVRAGHDVPLVVTQPDRPKGRGMELAPSPVKQKACELGLTFAQPEKIKNNAEFRAQLEALAADCIVVVGYGRIIPRWMLQLPRHGNINLHASLLPKYRGAAPIQWAIANGETTTGNTTMRIDEGLDTGDILLQQEMAIASTDTSLTLAPRLAAMGAELLVETLAALDGGRLQSMPQDNARATLAPILTREDGRIDFARDAQTIYNRHRGFQPWPGAFTTFRGKQLTLHSIALHSISVASPQHALAEFTIAVAGDQLLAGCGAQTAIAIHELQLEGKRRMSAQEFINGYHPRNGERLG
jgi:methionyl-tRNA formyltransferase